MSDVVNTENENKGLSLADIGGISVDDVAEVRFEDLPAMRAIFKITAVNWGDEVGDKNLMTCRLTCEVQQVGEFNDEQGTTPERIEKTEGRKHNETFFIDPKDALTGLGRIKAFLVDANLVTNPGENIKAACARFAEEGQGFVGDIKKRLKKDTEGEYYTNLHPHVESNHEVEEDAA